MQIWKYANVKYKYTNTQIYKYENRKTQIHKNENMNLSDYENYSEHAFVQLWIRILRLFKYECE